MDEGRLYDANDAAELRTFDETLWPLMEGARKYFYSRAGEMFGAHANLWKLVEQHGDLDQPIWLRIVLREHLAPLVEILQGPRDGDKVVIVTVDGIDLIGGDPRHRSGS
jgi:hypothetical protein